MSKFALGVNRHFIASHFLVGGDFGKEGELHSHRYRVEVIVEGDGLDEHGFLVDIVRLEQELMALIERYSERTLNDLPEFREKNTGVEVVSEAMAASLRARLSSSRIAAVTVKLWENEEAWASCRLEA